VGSIVTAAAGAVSPVVIAAGGVSLAQAEAKNIRSSVVVTKKARKRNISISLIKHYWQ
jgi:hypothetical protein